MLVMRLKEKALLKSEEEYSGASDYSDDDEESILPYSTDSEDERNYLKSLNQKKIPISKCICTKRKYLESNPDVMVERSLQGRKIEKIGEEWFSHPKHDDWSSPESSSSDDEQITNNKDIPHKVRNKKKESSKDQLSSCDLMDCEIFSSSTLKADSPILIINEDYSSDNEIKDDDDDLYVKTISMQKSQCHGMGLTGETSEESEQYDELYQEVIESSQNTMVDLTLTGTISDKKSNVLLQQGTNEYSNSFERRFFK